MNNTSLILHFLKSVNGWVSADVICGELQITKRSIRSGGENDITNFTISSDEGYKFVGYATDEEFNAFVSRIKSHALAELDRVRLLERARLPEAQQELVSL